MNVLQGTFGTIKDKIKNIHSELPSFKRVLYTSTLILALNFGFTGLSEAQTNGQPLNPEQQEKLEHFELLKKEKQIFSEMKDKLDSLHSANPSKDSKRSLKATQERIDNIEKEMGTLEVYFITERITYQQSEKNNEEKTEQKDKKQSENKNEIFSQEQNTSENITENITEIDHKTDIFEPTISNESVKNNPEFDEQIIRKFLSDLNLSYNGKQIKAKYIKINARIDSTGDETLYIVSVNYEKKGVTYQNVGAITNNPQELITELKKSLLDGGFIIGNSQASAPLFDNTNKENITKKDFAENIQVVVPDTVDVMKGKLNHIITADMFLKHKTQLIDFVRNKDIDGYFIIDNSYGQLTRSDITSLYDINMDPQNKDPNDRILRILFLEEFVALNIDELEKHFQQQNRGKGTKMTTTLRGKQISKWVQPGYGYHERIQKILQLQRKGVTLENIPRATFDDAIMYYFVLENFSKDLIMKGAVTPKKILVPTTESLRAIKRSQNISPVGDNNIVEGSVIGERDLVYENQSEYDFDAYYKERQERRGKSGCYCINDTYKHTLNLKHLGLKFNEPSRKITNKEVDIGTIFDNEKVAFDMSTFTLTSTAKQELDKLGHIMKNNPRLEVKVIGHTQHIGDFDKNIELSKQRALAIKTYMTENLGFDTKRIHISREGSTDPIDGTVPTASANRRVEFLFGNSDGSIENEASSSDIEINKTNETQSEIIQNKTKTETNHTNNGAQTFVPNDRMNSPEINSDLGRLISTSIDEYNKIQVYYEAHMTELRNRANGLSKITGGPARLAYMKKHSIGTIQNGITYGVWKEYKGKSIFFASGSFPGAYVMADLRALGVQAVLVDFALIQASQNLDKKIMQYANDNPTVDLSRIHSPTLPEIFEGTVNHEYRHLVPLRQKTEYSKLPIPLNYTEIDAFEQNLNGPNRQYDIINIPLQWAARQLAWEAMGNKGDCEFGGGLDKTYSYRHHQAKEAFEKVYDKVSIEGSITDLSQASYVHNGLMQTILQSGEAKFEEFRQQLYLQNYSRFKKWKASN